MKRPSCSLAVIELFVLNFGYQAQVLSHSISRPPKGIKTTQLTFGQDIRFGESPTTPDGLLIPGSNKQYLYREYESTLFNIGTILANEVFVDLYYNLTPRCSYVAGCGLVLSHNASIEYWSPDRIVLKRAGPGKIELNINNSSYLRVNNKRTNTKLVAERFERFYLPVSDSEQTITLVYSPAVP